MVSLVRFQVSQEMLIVIGVRTVYHALAKSLIGTFLTTADLLARLGDRERLCARLVINESLQELGLEEW